MSLPVAALVNAAAWAVLIGLIGASFVVVVILGPFGLILLGLVTLFICTSMDLREDTPTWGVQVFKARLERHGSAEQRAAGAAERRQALQPLRFHRWCGLVLLVAGLAGFAWQQLH